MAKKEIRIGQILSLSLDEFITKGYYGMSTRAIAKKAEISSGLMFHYFKSKDDLYLNLIKIGTEKMVYDFEAAKTNPKNYFKAMLENTLDQLENNPFYAKMFVFIDDALHTEGIPSEAKALLEKHDIGSQCIPIIIAGQRMGQFRSGNPHALCVAFFGAIQGVAQEKVRNTDTPLPSSDWLLDIICL